MDNDRTSHILKYFIFSSKSYAAKRYSVDKSDMFKQIAV